MVMMANQTFFANGAWANESQCVCVFVELKLVDCEI